MIINREAVVILGLAGRPGGPEISGDALTLVLNLTAIRIRNRLREKYRAAEQH